MLFVGGNIEEVADFHFDQALLELQPRRALEHDDPLVLRLVVPEIGGGSVAVRNDPLDPHISCTDKGFNNLLGHVVRKLVV